MRGSLHTYRVPTYIHVDSDLAAAAAASSSGIGHHETALSDQISVLRWRLSHHWDGWVGFRLFVPTVHSQAILVSSLSLGFLVGSPKSSPAQTRASDSDCLRLLVSCWNMDECVCHLLSTQNPRNSPSSVISLVSRSELRQIILSTGTSPDGRPRTVLRSERAHTAPPGRY